MKIRTISAVTFAAVVVSLGATATPALAHGRSAPMPHTGHQSTVASGLFTPLSLAMDGSSTAYVSENFAGVLAKVHDKKVTPVASAPGMEIGAVSYRNGTVYYAEVAQDHSSAWLMSLKDGKTHKIADLAGYEKRVNPDGHATYGFTDLPKWCAAKFPPAMPPEMNPPKYRGIVDTHPYASTATKDAIYVADAGANDILRVSYSGKITTAAVLPPSKPYTATAAAAAAAGMPSCVVGHHYRFEPVPTDVEVGTDGWLYVSSLPGGPEDNSLGARGAVFKVNPHNHKSVMVASGFSGTTGLAVSKTGYIYVAEMFGGSKGTGQVSVVRPGTWKGTPLVSLTSPAAIELMHGSLYVTTKAFVPDATGNPQPIGEITKVPVSVNRHWEEAYDVWVAPRHHSEHHSTPASHHVSDDHSSHTRPASDVHHSSDGDHDGGHWCDSHRAHAV